MIMRNIWKNIKKPLQLHKDKRGEIVDVFYGENINHIAVINSKSGAERGSHYHKRTIQHVLVVKGILEYWYKPLDSKLPAKFKILKEGDMVTSSPFEIHAFKIIKNNQFIVFTQGIRGGKDYELDTYRVNPSIIKNKKLNKNKKI